MKPEYRLRSMPVGAILLPAGLFIYGWTAEYRTHWIAPVSSSRLSKRRTLLFRILLVLGNSKWFCC